MNSVEKYVEKKLNLVNDSNKDCIFGVIGQTSLYNQEKTKA